MLSHLVGDISEPQAAVALEPDRTRYQDTRLSFVFIDPRFTNTS